METEPLFIVGVAKPFDGEISYLTRVVDDMDDRIQLYFDTLNMSSALKMKRRRAFYLILNGVPGMFIYAAPL